MRADALPAASSRRSDPIASSRILFVCLGNICRSPLAEGAMRAAADRLGVPVDVDSAGTGDWHVGRPPDPRAIATGARHGVDISGLRARQVAAGDFYRFDHVVALDRRNLGDLRRLMPADARADLTLLLDHADGRQGQDVADPYFGEDAGFDAAWRDIVTGVESLLAKLGRQPSE
jgi:protein-tyrosine phosphatase